MGKKVFDVAIIGCGSRGRDAYGKLFKKIRTGGTSFRFATQMKKI